MLLIDDDDNQSIDIADIVTLLLLITLSDNLSLVCCIVYYLLTIRLLNRFYRSLITLYKCIVIIVIRQCFNQSLMIDEDVDVNRVHVMYR